MLESLFSAVLAMSLTGSALWLFLRLARPLTGRLCSARWERASRILVFCAFLIPVGLLLRPSLAPAPVFTLPGALTPYGTAASLPPIWTLSGQNEKTGAAASLFSGLGGVWLGGAAACAVFFAARQRHFITVLRRTALPLEEPGTLALLAAQCGALGLERVPPLFTSDRVGTPLGAGLLQPALYLPEVPMEREELELVLRHELVHLKRRDLWLKWLSLAVVTLHWFNPGAWCACREWELLCETACDEAATDGLDSEGRRRYGRTILSVLHRAAPAEDGVCAPFCAGKAGLKRRLRRVLRARPGRVGQAVCSLSAAALLLALMPFTASVHAWTQPCHNWGSPGDFQANMAREALNYLPFGVTYDANADQFYHQGEAISAFIDEVPPTQEDLALFPQFTAIWKCSWFHWDDLSGPACRAVRDGQQRLSGVTRLSEEEKTYYLEASQNSVCYSSCQTVGGDEIYASDPAWASLPQQVREWAMSVPEGTAAAMGEGKSGYLCYRGVRCPWQLKLAEDGAMEAHFYPGQGGEPPYPCVIRYTAKTGPAAIRFYADGQPISGKEP